MKEMKMSRKQIESMIIEAVETHEPQFIGTQGISVLNGAIITKIDNLIYDMGLTEKVETKFFDDEWYIVRKYHN